MASFFVAGTLEAGPPKCQAQGQEQERQQERRWWSTRTRQRTRRPRLQQGISVMLLLWLVLTLLSGVPQPAEAWLWGNNKKKAAEGQHEKTPPPKKAASPTTPPTDPRRERNLDHWDCETLSAYLGWNETSLEQAPHSYVGTDAAVMFYASWCPNCHALAPLWDHLATHVEAGTKRANLIMALFNCELSTRHAQLCSAVGIKHYPTLLFIGSGPYHDVDFLTSLGRKEGGLYAGKAKMNRTVKFQGDWQYLNAILDWIRTMQGLSRWHEWNHGVLRPHAILQWIRRGGFLPRLGGRKAKGKGGAESQALPIGVPPPLATVGGGGTTGGGSQDAMAAAAELNSLRRSLETLEQKVETAERSKELLDKVAIHSTLTVDSMLFPMTPPSSGAKELLGRLGMSPDEMAPLLETNSTSSSSLDAFQVLHSMGAWDNLTASSSSSSSTLFGMAGDKDKKESITNATVLRFCVLEKTLDYCTRVSTHAAADWLDQVKHEAEDEKELPSVEELTTLLQKRISATEPYCPLLDDCIKSNFANPPECRPSTCPFDNPMACVYVSTCLESFAREEYEQALGVRDAAAASSSSQKQSALASLDALLGVGGSGGYRKLQEDDDDDDASTTTVGGSGSGGATAWGLA